MKGLMKPMEFESAVSYLSRNFFDILPEEGYRVDTILEKAETLVRRKGIRIFILDPYNCLEHQIPSGQSETQYISEFLEKLRSFARRRQVLVILAAHPTKMKRDPLTKQFPGGVSAGHRHTGIVIQSNLKTVRQKCWSNSNK